MNRKEIDESDGILEDIQCIIDEYKGDNDIDVCSIRLGNCNRWSNYSIIFDENNDKYVPCEMPYENELLINIIFDTDEKNGIIYNNTTKDPRISVIPIVTVSQYMGPT